MWHTALFLLALSWCFGIFRIARTLDHSYMTLLMSVNKKIKLSCFSP